MSIKNKTASLLFLLAFSALLWLSPPVSAQVLNFFMDSPTPAPSPMAGPTTATGSAVLTITPTGPVRVLIGDEARKGVFVENSLNIVVVRDGNLLVAGGEFSRTQIGSAEPQLRRNLDAVNLETNTLYDWNPSPDARVDTISIDSSAIYVGGRFQNIAGAPRRFFAAFDRHSFVLLPWAPNPNDHVYASHADQSRVWLGGRFSEILGWPRQRIASFQKPGYTLQEFNPGVNGDIFIMNGTNEVLYIGGEFTEVAGQQRRYLAAFSKETGELLPWAPAVSAPVRRISISRDGYIITNGIVVRANGDLGNEVRVIDPETGVFLSPDALDKEESAALLPQLRVNPTTDIIIDQTALGFQIPTLGDILTFFIRIFFVIAGLVALVYLLLGAFAWITSGGDEEAVGASRKKIVAAVVGVIMIVAVLAVVVALEQIVFRRTICFGLSCPASIPSLVRPVSR